MTLLSEWSRLKKQLEQQDSKVLEHLITAYGQSYSRLTPEIEALIEKMEADLASGKLTKQTVAKSAAFKNLIREVERELTDYSGYLKTEAATAADVAGRSGLSGGKFLMLAALADAIGVSIADMPREAVKSAPPDALAFLADYLRKDGPLYQRIDGLSGYHAEQIANGILERVGQGLNPREIAKEITNLYGMGLTDSMRNVRTVQLYAYRGANLEVMKSNSEVVQGWIWSAELDDATCPVCVAESGTVHSLDETMDAHYNCRCSPLPWVVGADNPISTTGETWLNNQNEITQKEVLGGKFYGWKNGDFALQDIIDNYQSDTFGNMLVEKPLKDIIK
jgi:SPP1 gp7 family putative phage head morphogenesis protein